MKKIFLVFAVVTWVLLAFSLSGCTETKETLGGILQNQQEGIWVNGTGKVSVAPDIATLSLGIESQEASVATAQTKATEAMNQVMDALNQNGVDKKDIQTQYFSITKVTRWDEEQQKEIVIGYRVSNIVTAKIRTIGNVGSIIDSVAVAGGDLTRIDNISFSVDKPEAYHSEIREKAMKDAEAKAKELATLGGVTLGKPTYISESLYTPSPIYQIRPELAPAPAMAPTPISPGEMEMTLNVQVVYEIQ